MDLYLLRHRGRALQLATRSKVAPVERNGDNATSQLQHEPRGLRITADGMICVLPGQIYIASATVGVDTRTLRGNDVALDTCSGDNFIAGKRLHFGWEQCIAKNSNIPSLAGADESPLSLSSVISLAIRFGSMVYCARFVIADRLGVNL